MDATGRSSVTPEAVRLRLDVAEIGSRMIALAIDHAIQGVVLFLSVLLISTTVSALGDMSEAGLVVLLVIGFLVVWGYFPVFESAWRGQTPGKRAMKLRVVRTDGSPARVPDIVVRNLVRIVDFLPASYALGVVAMIVSKRAQRLGDLAAGTVVVREPRALVARAADLPAASPGSPSVDVGGLSAREDALVHGFLTRRAALDPPARAALAAQIAAVIRARTNTEKQPGASDETYIEAVARALRPR